MDKETFEKLLADKPVDIRGRAVLLYNGAAKCAEEYQKNPTATSLRDWEAAQAALAKFTEQIGVRDDAERPFSTVADVLGYLKEDGWRVTQPTLYRHQKEGKLFPQRDGSYARKDVDKYARTWLKQKSTGKRISDRTDELQRKKLEVELRNLDLDNKRKERLDAKETGNLVPREQMEIELATRAGILDAGLKHWIQSRAAEWCRLVAGDMKKVGELINLMSRDLDEHINTYASASEYQVVIDAAEEAETEAFDGESLTPEEVVAL